MTKARDLADLISAGNPLADGAISVSEISDLTATAAELNTLDGITATTSELNGVAGINTNVQTQLDLKAPLASPTFTGTATIPTAAVTTLNLGGTDITATATELNYVDGVTSAVQTQLNAKVETLSDLGVTATSAELNYVDGVTSNIQTQLDNISVTSGSLTKTFSSGESATITLAQSISPAPVVSVTKEVSQTGVSSKGSWDVNATASNYDLHDTAYATTLSFNYSAVSNLTYDSVSFSVASQGTSPNGLYFKSDGTKMYVGNQSDKTVYQYTLSTAFDLTTASYDSVSFSGATEITSGLNGMSFNSDGTIMYLVGYGTSSGVWQYTLSTAWDISTASYASKFLNTAALDTYPTGMDFNADGTKAYISGANGNAVLSHSLSTAYDISTATYDSVFLAVSAPQDFKLVNNGTKALVASGNIIYDYSLSTAYDLSTATSNTSINVTDNVFELYVANSKVYILNDQSIDAVRQWSLPTLLTLGTGSFASTDVGKRIQGNGGDVILTSTAGAYSTTGGSDFTDSSTIASGSWTMTGLESLGDSSGIGVNSSAGPAYTTSTGSFTGNDVSIQQSGIITGPESGFSENEEIIIKNQSSQTYLLGDFPLKAETAAIVAVSLIQHQKGLL